VTPSPGRGVLGNTPLSDVSDVRLVCQWGRTDTLQAAIHAVLPMIARGYGKAFEELGSAIAGGCIQSGSGPVCDSVGSLTHGRATGLS